VARKTSLKVGDVVVYRARVGDPSTLTRMKIDGFVADAMGRLYVALSYESDGKGAGTMLLGQVRRAPEVQ
jgi:hypothetical protein